MTLGFLIAGATACDTGGGEPAGVADQTADSAKDVGTDTSAVTDVIPDIPSDLPGRDDTKPEIPDLAVADEVDVTCDWSNYPDVSDNCIEATTLDWCGFEASCDAGVIYALWHYHVCDCGESDACPEGECTYSCPHGCMAGEPSADYVWDGTELVAALCAQCAAAEDCLDQLVPPLAGPGEWACQEGRCVWAEPPACLGEGGTFLDFNTEGKCCDGLVASSDCQLIEGQCSCPKCPCYVCLPCGNGICDPGEHACNCAQDCPLETTACVPAKMSECLGGDPYNSPNPQGTLTLEASEGTISVTHKEFVTNCCYKMELCYTLLGSTITITEKVLQPASPCFCECIFDLTADLTGIPAGAYAVTLASDSDSAVALSGEVVVP